jgi:hypothetical protein
MADQNDKKQYDALDVPQEAQTLGGVELLRVGVNEDKLFIEARPALTDPAEWGEILAEITRRLGLLYEMSDTGFSEEDVVVAIEEAYAAELGAGLIDDDDEDDEDDDEDEDEHKAGPKPSS